MASTAATTSSAVSRSVTRWKCTSRPVPSRQVAAATVGDARLAAAAETDQRDEAGVRVVQAPHDGVDQVVATEGRRPRDRQPSGFARHGLVRQGGVAAARVTLEDRGLDPLERLARLDAQLVGHHRPRLGVHLEGLLAAVLDVEGRHQLSPEPLPGGVLGGGGAELLDGLGRPPQLEEQLEALLDEGVTQLGEPLDGRACERHVLDAREHRTAPGPERLLDRVQGLPGLVVAHLLPGQVGQPLHVEGVDVGRVDREPEPVGTGLEQRARAVGADPLHQGVERAGRRQQRTPQPDGHGVGRDRLPRGQRQQRDQGALALAGGRPRSAVDDDLHRAQQPNEHGAQRRAAGGR